jgi:streptomycin 6-kinase
MFIIPDTFARFMVTLYGEEGREWIERLPAILAACERCWHITIATPFSNLSFQYVAPAVCADGTPVVVKASPPDGEFAHQSEALHLFDGHGMVQLLASDATDKVMLLERLLPGTLLTTVEDDEKAISIAASVMRQFWRPAPEQHPFPTVQDWGKGFTRLRAYYGGGCGPFPAALLEQAERLYAELSATMDAPALLHGDLHQENILAAQRQPWLAIDPKGLIGEPAYETGPLLSNPLPQLLQMPQPGRVLARRVDQMAEELDLDRARVRDWGLAQAVLSAWWSVEDTGDLSDFAQGTLTCAELLAALKR